MNIYNRKECLQTVRCKRNTCFKQSDFDRCLYKKYKCVLKDGLSRDTSIEFFFYKPIIKVVYYCIRSWLHWA